MPLSKGLSRCWWYRQWHLSQQPTSLLFLTKGLIDFGFPEFFIEPFRNLAGKIAQMCICYPLQEAFCSTGYTVCQHIFLQKNVLLCIVCSNMCLIYILSTCACFCMSFSKMHMVCISDLSFHVYKVKQSKLFYQLKNLQEMIFFPQP